MSEDRTFSIKPSRFQWHKTKDYIHLYFLLGAIPVGITITLINVFIGPATLEEIPEGYVPKEWEYLQVKYGKPVGGKKNVFLSVSRTAFVRILVSRLFQHPIKRFFQRYIFPSPQQEYEKYLHFIYHENQLRKVRILERQVNEAMGTRRDYRGPYFKEFYDSKYLHKYRKALDKRIEMDD